MRLTVKQAASHAGVSRSMIYQWVEERRLPHTRLGGKGRRGKIFVEQADLDAFLAGCRVEAAEPQRPGKAEGPPAPPLRLKHLDLN
jgi:excisionase family DNA binding protein